MLLFHRLRQPPVLDYLIAGVLIDPYALPVPPPTDIQTILMPTDLVLDSFLGGRPKVYKPYLPYQ